MSESRPASGYDIDIEVDPAFAARVDAAGIAGLVETTLAAEDVEPGSGIALRVAGDELLRELNRAHRGIDEPTDVLSFGADEGEAFPAAEGEPRYLGDIAISIEAIERQAEAAGLEATAELAHVVLHGVLHLLGYDHETDEDDAAMRAREEAVLGPEIHARRAGHSDA